MAPEPAIKAQARLIGFDAGSGQRGLRMASIRLIHARVLALFAAAKKRGNPKRSPRFRSPSKALLIQCRVEAGAAGDDLRMPHEFEEITHWMQPRVDRHDPLRFDADALEVVEKIHVLRIDRRLRLAL